MIEPEMRKAIFLLHREGMGARGIARSLQISRNTVKSIIAGQGAMPDTSRKDKIRIDPELLRRLHDECQGFVQRVHEKLVEEENIEVKYSTLTRMIRELGLGKEINERCDRVPDVPGAEMQHDTSSYIIALGDRPREKVIASSLYLRYSKRRYLKFYRSFNRFRMKCFFHEALMHWGCSASTCVIDNTNLARQSGIGKNAVMAPEMAAFSSQYGFEFLCHEKGHSDRKAGEERSFWTVETNFFPGRRFLDFEDLNAQGFEWATVRMEHRPTGKAGLIPSKAFEYEQRHLIALPHHLPAPYLARGRGTDQYGFAAVDGNYFWVPGKDRRDVIVLEFSDRLKIYCGRDFLIEYPLPPDGVKNKRFSPEGPEPRHAPKNRRKPTVEEEKRLRALGETVGAWLDFALEPGGIARHRAVRELYRLSRETPAPVFLRAVERALKFRIHSVMTIRRIAYLYMNEDQITLPSAEVDESLLERATYLEGRLTDQPDLTAWEGMMDADEEESEPDHG